MRKILLIIAGLLWFGIFSLVMILAIAFRISLKDWIRAEAFGMH